MRSNDLSYTVYRQRRFSCTGNIDLISMSFIPLVLSTFHVFLLLPLSSLLRSSGRFFFGCICVLAMPCHSICLFC